MKEIYFKDLVHLIVEAGTSQVCKAGQQARDAVRSQGCRLEAEYLLPQELCRKGFSTDEML